MMKSWATGAMTGVMLLAGSAQAQAFRGFAGNMAMSRLTMQPVDAQRRRAVAAANAHRPFSVPAYGPRRYPAGSLQAAYAHDPLLQARIEAAVRREIARRRLIGATR